MPGAVESLNECRPTDRNRCGLHIAASVTTLMITMMMMMMIMIMMMMPFDAAEPMRHNHSSSETL